MADETRIQWHSAFCSAMELTLIDNAGSLEYNREYNLSRKPLQVDMLVIHREDGTPIRDEVGKIFRRYNVLEYKSPGDDLSIDTYYKVLAYGSLLKVQKSETVNKTKRQDITLTMVRREKPEQMFKDLASEGITVESDYPGICHLRGGVTFETQVIVTKELPPETHIWLKVLTRDLDAEDAGRFVSRMAAFPEGSYERRLADSVMQAAVSANFKTFEKLREEDPIMCDALRELMKPELEEAVDKKVEEMAIKMIRANEPDSKISEYTGLAVKKIEELRKNATVPA